MIFHSPAGNVNARFLDRKIRCYIIFTKRLHGKYMNSRRFVFVSFPTELSFIRWSAVHTALALTAATILRHLQLKSAPGHENRNRRANIFVVVRAGVPEPAAGMSGFRSFSKHRTAIRCPLGGITGLRRLFTNRGREMRARRRKIYAPHSPFYAAVTARS